MCVTVILNIFGVILNLVSLFGFLMIFIMKGDIRRNREENEYLRKELRKLEDDIRDLKFKR